jgi:hypothetical protein
MFHATQKEKTATFEDLAVLAAQFPVQVSARFINGPVDEGDDVVGIMNDIHAGKDFCDGVQICRRHIHGDGSELGSFTLELFQEWNQCRRIPSLMGMQYRSGFQIDDNSHIVVTFAGRKLIDSDVSHLVEFPPLEAQGKVTFENRFDHIPPNAQKERDVFDGANMAQVNDIPLKNLKPPSLPFSEVNRLLQITATTSTLLKMAMKNHKLFPSPNREGVKCPCDCTVHDQMNPSCMAMSAPPCLFLLADVIIDGALPKLGLLMMVARQTQSVVKITCRRHGQSPFVFWLGDQHEIYCPGDDFSIPDFVDASPRPAITLTLITSHPGICRMSLN